MAQPAIWTSLYKAGGKGSLLALLLARGENPSRLVGREGLSVSSHTLSLFDDETELEHGPAVAVLDRPRILLLPKILLQRVGKLVLLARRTVAWACAHVRVRVRLRLRERVRVRVCVRVRVLVSHCSSLPACPSV